MTRRTDKSDAMADRAIELYEQGALSRVMIAERMGVRPANISGMLQRARQRREKAKEGVE